MFAVEPFGLHYSKVEDRKYEEVDLFVIPLLYFALLQKNDDDRHVRMMYDKDVYDSLSYLSCQDNPVLGWLLRIIVHKERLTGPGIFMDDILYCRRQIRLMLLSFINPDTSDTSLLDYITVNQDVSHLDRGTLEIYFIIFSPPWFVNRSNITIYPGIRTLLALNGGNSADEGDFEIFTPLHVNTILSSLLVGNFVLVLTNNLKLPKYLTSIVTIYVICCNDLVAFYDNNVSKMYIYVQDKGSDDRYIYEAIDRVYGELIHIIPRHPLLEKIKPTDDDIARGIPQEIENVDAYRVEFKSIGYARILECVSHYIYDDTLPRSLTATDVSSFYFKSTWKTISKIQVTDS